MGGVTIPDIERRGYGEQSAGSLLDPPRGILDLAQGRP